MLARITFVLLFWLLSSSAALAERRMALLIGNQAYSDDIGKLSNPHNDIALLERTLKGMQFEVTPVHDAGLAALHQAVNAYVRRVRAAGPDTVAFFYYAGHGASDAGGINYLIPVDVKSAEEGDLWDVSLRLTEITRKLKTEAGNATHFVVFDACRNELKLRKSGTKALMQSRGFVPVAQESGMLIAYATAEGELASDVGAGAGPYSRVLAEEIVKPGVEAVTMFRNVQRRVRLAIKQEPYLAFNALGDIYFAGHTLGPWDIALSAAPAQSPPPKPVIIIDPGHGGVDPGAMIEGVTEKDLVLDYGTRIAKEIKRSGVFDVFLTRTTDEFVSLDSRIQLAKDKKATVFVSLHAESSTESPNTDGVHVYAPKGNAANTSGSSNVEFSDVFSKFLVGHLAGTASIENNPFKSANFKVLRDLPDETARVLIELGNLSNPTDRRRLQSPAQRDALVAAVARAAEGMRYLAKRP